MMKEFFNYGDIKENENEIKKTWNEFRKALKKNKFSINDIDKAKQCIFLKQYDDLFTRHNGIKYKTITIHDLITKNMGRGSILKEDEKIDYERFVPKKEFIKHDNRFSPPGMEWLYLAIGNNDDDIHQCAQLECRAKNGERFGFCYFGFNKEKYGLKLVDLTIADNKTYTMINRELDNYVQKIYKKSKRRVQKYGFIKENNIVNEQEFQSEYKRWAVFTYSKLISENIFVPLNTSEDGEEKENIYAPFQVMAQYYASLGFSGIVYESTVFKNCKNIVLFNKNIASPIGDIEDYIIK